MSNSQLERSRMGLLAGLRSFRRNVQRDPDVERARTAVLLGGLPEQVARKAERHNEVDWRVLAAAMDSLFMATGSTLGVRRFWISPQDSLNGRAPVEVLPRKGGPRQVEAAAYKASAKATALRAG